MDFLHLVAASRKAQFPHENPLPPTQNDKFPFYAIDFNSGAVKNCLQF